MLTPSRASTRQITAIASQGLGICAAHYGTIHNGQGSVANHVEQLSWTLGIYTKKPRRDLEPICKWIFPWGQNNKDIVSVYQDALSCGLFTLEPIRTLDEYFLDRPFTSRSLHAAYRRWLVASSVSNPGSPITSPFVAVNPSLLNEFKFRIPVRVLRSMWVRDKDIIQAKKFRIGVSNETIGSADSNSIFTRRESVHSFFFFHRKTEMGESSGAARYKHYGFGG